MWIKIAGVILAGMVLSALVVLFSIIPNPNVTRVEKICAAEWADFENRVLVTEGLVTGTHPTCQVKIGERWVNASAVKIDG